MRNYAHTIYSTPARLRGLGDILLLPESFDIKIGNTVTPEVEEQFGGVYTGRPDWTAYIDSVGQKVARKSKRPDRTYTFKILNHDMLNAFALPNGNIYITTGLLNAIQNEAQLAGVLGHEVGHVADRHGMQRYQIALAGSLIGGKYLDNPESLANVAIGLITSGFSRNDELEADLIGAKAMSNAGYNPEGIVQLMQILGSVSQQDPDLLARFFTTHPPPYQRVEELRGYIYSKYPPQKHHVFEEGRYQKVIHGVDEDRIPGEVSRERHLLEIGLIGIGLWILLR